MGPADGLLRYNRDAGKLAQATVARAFSPTGAFLPAIFPFGAVGPFVPGGRTHYFDGYYAQGAWWITGEERAASYDVKDKSGATFVQIKIKDPLSAGGIGAWGLAARFGSVNLNNGPYQGSTLYNLLYATTLAAANPPNPGLRSYVANSGVYGGRQQDLTVGVNWYPDAGVAIQANWTRVMNIVATFNGNPGQTYYTGAHPNLFEVRAKVYW